ncbi:gamma-glutamyltranspeptidase [Mollisia scopiformis]|uniref:Glutathione hydrolase n=1 Tax=Mollisia scopiformis TaxID=149040 RepID=A0A132B2I2_MOLSC|nr:gamma-glutamyltranspeptidase [Mollisia scopiformis]KUJ06596.1 gamma-glutamyltranspeptidase [Mollisia scopiformis]
MKLGIPLRLIGRISKWQLVVTLLSGVGTCAPWTSGTDSLGAVSSESRLCSEIGIELLERGGNAADALVGTALCVGVVGMQHSGIGGGGFMLVRGPDGKYESIDYRETAPAAAHRDMYKDNVLGSVWSGLASGVPSDLRGLEYLHNKYGVLPWRAVCNPAVHVARYGFPVTEDLVWYMNAAMSFNNGSNPFLTEDPSWAVDFAPNGTLLGLDETLTRKRYANTLETIAKYGAGAFYEGEIANYTIAAIQAQNGTMTLEDLKNYAVSVREPISIKYKGYNLHSTGVPSGGGVALSILKIMEGYNITDLNDIEEMALNTHRFDEAMRYAYAARSELGDPDFFSYMVGLEAEMLKSKTAAKTREKILDDRTKNVTDYRPLPNSKQYFLPENHGTSHIVTSDASGLSISSTSTVNLLFGSQLVVPETGVIMNNEMNDFSIPGVPNAFGFVPSPINYIAPGKRPLSSISPIIVEHPNGTLYLSVGAAGGSRIITSTAQTVWHVLDHEMMVPEALAAPRLHDQLMPAYTTFEKTFNKDVIEIMKEKGHNTSWAGVHDSAVQGVRRLWNGTFEAGSEPRQFNSGGLAV